MNKIKKIAENVYYSIFNIVDYANYTFFHFFFGADIVTKVVVVALALVGLFFPCQGAFQPCRNSCHESGEHYGNTGLESHLVPDEGYGKSLPVCLRAAELFRPYEAVQSQVSR